MHTPLRLRRSLLPLAPQSARGVTEPPSAASPAAPFVAERADRLLKQMSDYIGSADQFTFHADISFDHVLPSAQKLQFSAAHVALRRPGWLYVEWQSDLGDRQFWYDGKAITLSDLATPFYATETAPPDIDGMLDRLVPRIDFAPPLADFLYHYPYQNVRRRLQYGIYLGLNDVSGRHGDGERNFEQEQACNFVPKEISHTRAGRIRPQSNRMPKIYADRQGISVARMPWTHRPSRLAIRSSPATATGRAAALTVPCRSAAAYPSVAARIAVASRRWFGRIPAPLRCR